MGQRSNKEGHVCIMERRKGQIEVMYIKRRKEKGCREGREGGTCVCVCVCVCVNA